MVTSIKLPDQDLQNIYIANYAYESQIALLRLLLKEEIHPTYLDFIGKQWEEARKLQFTLETTKQELKDKYYPQDGQTYKIFDFNFKKGLINFYTED